ncbi:hypothetical protein [Streptomyces sp. Tu 3180]|uniref:hypothetical protein n=1 Tax=Streptomyces sp. Tu 3180 TaxID=2682611 RepID=UPI00135CD660|nr:hypothetical protein [Streptomyces sp. Tu 3180]KAF3463182.1 hypothetical protein GL259_01265 [Streptomyces sp. Tu 3180]
MDQSPDPVAALCAQLQVLRVCAPEEAERLVAGARQGSDIGAELSRLLLRLDMAVVSDTDRSAPVGPAMIGGFGRHAVHEHFRCPAERCSRVQARRPAAPAPVCHLEGVPMRLTRS